MWSTPRGLQQFANSSKYVHFSWLILKKISYVTQTKDQIKETNTWLILMNIPISVKVNMQGLISTRI